MPGGPLPDPTPPRPLPVPDYWKDKPLPERWHADMNVAQLMANQRPMLNRLSDLGLLTANIEYERRFIVQWLLSPPEETKA
jgi:hypothetical protein